MDRAVRAPASRHRTCASAFRRGGIALLLGSLLLPLWAHAADAAKRGAPADLVVVNARIYTVNSRQPWAEALAVRGERIVAVGRTSEILRHRGPGTRVMDAHGRLVLPGFVDSHIHFMDGSLSLERISLEHTRDVAAIQNVVREFAAAHPATTAENAWLLGRGWTYPEFPGFLPYKKYLDEIVPDRPVFLEGFDGHTYWANSKALELAGVTRDTPDPANGAIVRDPQTGEPTGALKEAAAELVQRVVPRPTPQQRLQALRAGIAEANRNGLVRIHSCGGDFEYLDLFQELRRQGQLTLRLYFGYFLEPPGLTPATLAALAEAQQHFNDDWISVGAVKTMLDGVVESHTAAMLAPYADDATQSGKLFWDADQYRRAVAELDGRGWQVFTHAIGDRAVRLALDAYEAAQKAGGSRDARHRIEHIETITPEDIPRFGRLGVIASFQPLHAYPDDDTLKVWARNAGPDRASRGWTWHSVAAAGGQLAFGSDWPVVTLNPWDGLQNAVTRQTWEGNPPGGWLAGERVSLAQAIAAYTLGAAVAGRRERSEGSLEAGKLADLIVVSQDVFHVDPHRIRETQVLLTLVGGKVVYQSSAWVEPAPQAVGKKR